MDKTLFKIFHSLTDKEEKRIISSIMDSIIFISNNKEKFEKYFDVDLSDKKSFADFYLQYIGKDEEIERYLKDINVIADMYNYIEKYVYDIIKLKNGIIENNIYLKKDFRIEKQAKELYNCLIKL